MYTRRRTIIGWKGGAGCVEKLEKPIAFRLSVLAVAEMAIFFPLN